MANVTSTVSHCQLHDNKKCKMKRAGGGGGGCFEYDLRLPKYKCKSGSGWGGLWGGCKAKGAESAPPQTGSQQTGEIMATSGLEIIAWFTTRKIYMQCLHNIGRVRVHSRCELSHKFRREFTAQFRRSLKCCTHTRIMRSVNILSRQRAAYNTILTSLFLRSLNNSRVESTHFNFWRGEKMCWYYIEVDVAKICNKYAFTLCKTNDFNFYSLSK